MSYDPSQTPTPAPAPAPAVIPAEPTNVPTSFLNLPVHARRVEYTFGGARWELYVEINGVPWVFATRKAGGLDDDLQERATPGFKEARALRYAASSGIARTEPGPGA